VPTFVHVYVYARVSVSVWNVYGVVVSHWPPASLYPSGQTLMVRVDGPGAGAGVSRSSRARVVVAVLAPRSPAGAARKAALPRALRPMPISSS